MPPAPPSCCARCRYDLRGTAPDNARCPECGQALTRATLAIARERRFLRRLAGRLVLFAVIAIALAAGATFLLHDRAARLGPLFAIIMALGAAPMLAAAYGERALQER